MSGIPAAHRVLQTEGSISESFTLRKYRQFGIGEAVACDVFSCFPGRWRLSVNVANEAGIACWRTILSHITNAESTEQPSDRPGWDVHEFTIQKP